MDTTHKKHLYEHTRTASTKTEHTTNIDEHNKKHNARRGNTKPNADSNNANSPHAKLTENTHATQTQAQQNKMTPANAHEKYRNHAHNNL